MGKDEKEGEGEKEREQEIEKKPKQRKRTMDLLCIFQQASVKAPLYQFHWYVTDKTY